MHIYSYGKPVNFLCDVSRASFTDLRKPYATTRRMDSNNNVDTSQRAQRALSTITTFLTTDGHNLFIPFSNGCDATRGQKYKKDEVR